MQFLEGSEACLELPLLRVLNFCSPWSSFHLHTDLDLPRLCMLDFAKRSNHCCHVDAEQEAEERKQDVHDFASDVERQLRARTASTSAALAELLQQVDEARRASAEASGPVDAVSRVSELEAGELRHAVLQSTEALSHTLSVS